MFSFFKRPRAASSFSGKGKASARRRRLLIAAAAALLLAGLLLPTLSGAGKKGFPQRRGCLTQGDEWTVTLPGGFTASRDSAAEQGGETVSLYVLRGSRSTASVTGYLREAWLTVSLDRYLQEAAEHRSAAIFDFTQGAVQAGGRTGYEWRYKIKKEDGSSTSVRSAFFAGSNKFYTVLFSAPSGQEAVLEQVFEETLTSLVFADSVQSGKTAGWYSFRRPAFSRDRPLFRAERADDRTGRLPPAEAAPADPFRS